MEEKILYKINIKGDVQGVGFRWNAANAARNLGITGYVKNQPDGSVYIEAEGYREQLNYYVRWCKNGPGYVEEVKTETFPPEGYTEFGILH